MPDIIMLDISMPGGGVNAARDIQEALPSIKLVMLTAQGARRRNSRRDRLDFGFRQ
jgi:DNA-binding NarL/FixJ family response regulator